MVKRARDEVGVSDDTREGQDGKVYHLPVRSLATALPTGALRERTRFVRPSLVFTSMTAGGLW